MLLLAFIALTLVLLYFLNLLHEPVKPKLVCRDEMFARLLLESCPHLDDPFVPTKVWGFSGHIQTVLYCIIDRPNCRDPVGERVCINLSDGSTLTYDIFQPLERHESGENLTVVLCPGICNSSESGYIRTFVQYAQNHGYRCVVLNHLGAIKSVKLSSHRIFSYGCPENLHCVIGDVLNGHPDTKIVLIGFSMGGNIVTNYLGKKGCCIPSSVIGGISICQAYDALSAMQHLLARMKLERFYVYMMTQNMKQILKQHEPSVLNDQVKSRYMLCEREIFSATNLIEFDEAYTRRVANYDNYQELYKDLSSCQVMDNISLPIVFINALDDPIVPQFLLQWPEDFANSRQKSAFIATAHGGHLGFYEGGIFRPNQVTWLERTAIAIADALVRL